MAFNIIKEPGGKGRNLVRIFFSLVCALFPRKMGKKCGWLIKLKQTLQRFVFKYYIPLGTTVSTAFKPIMFVSLEKWAIWSGLGLGFGLGLGLGLS